MNHFNFITMLPQVDVFSFIFWKKLKTPKRHLNYLTFRQGEREGAQWSDLAPFFFEI